MQCPACCPHMDVHTGGGLPLPPNHAHDHLSTTWNRAAQAKTKTDTRSPAPAQAHPVHTIGPPAAIPPAAAHIHARALCTNPPAHPLRAGRSRLLCSTWARCLLCSGAPTARTATPASTWPGTFLCPSPWRWTTRQGCGDVRSAGDEDRGRAAGGGRGRCRGLHTAGRHGGRMQSQHTV
jgi:hypothetical protein